MVIIFPRRKNAFIREEPASEAYFRLWYGTQELKNGNPRYCLLVKTSL
jgi:hypothetical protein